MLELGPGTRTEEGGMTGARVDQHTVEEIVGLRGMTDDEVVDILLDQQAALAIADRIRAAAAAGGDTVADRGHAPRPTTTAR
jgi:hypothetical protein